MADVATPRENFRWGNGVNTATGYDPNAQNGNTNSWTDKDWAAYDAKNGGGAATSQVGTGGGAAATGPYAPTSGAAATQATVSQQDQGTLRDALINQMTQSAIPDANDPAIAAQATPYKAAIERAQRGQVRQEAESGFASGQDYGVPEQRMAAEHAGQATGLMESQLVGREIESRRNQIQQALGQFGNMLSGDQQRALQKQLADLDAQVRREGLSVQNTLGQGDLSLRRDLGTGGLNNQLLGILLNNQQGNDSLGLQAAGMQNGMNRDALLAAFG